MRAAQIAAGMSLAQRLAWAEHLKKDLFEEVGTVALLHC
jgi:hypothetical protein